MSLSEEHHKGAAMKRKVMVAVAAVACTLALAGCGQTQQDLKRDAEFAKQCVDAGGRVWYAGIASEIIRCDFTGKEK